MINDVIKYTGKKHTLRIELVSWQMLITGPSQWRMTKVKILPQNEKATPTSKLKERSKEKMLPATKRATPTTVG